MKSNIISSFTEPKNTKNEPKNQKMKQKITKMTQKTLWMIQKMASSNSRKSQSTPYFMNGGQIAIFDILTLKNIYSCVCKHLFYV